MRIRFIVPDAYRVGGTVRTVFNLSGALARDHQVEVASLARSRAQPALAPPPGVQLVPLQDARGLIAYIRAAQDGVLIGTRPRINLALALLAPPGVLAVGQEHFHLAHHPLRKRVAMQCMYHRLDAHVSLTHGDAAAYRRLLRHDAMVRCIPNGVGDPGVAPSATMTPVAVSAGRLSRQKGFDLLLVAWSDVVKVHPDWTLRIFGEGEQRRHLESLIDQLDIAAHVELAGFSDRLLQEFAQSSFFILSSRFEGLPMVLLEAMSCGLPVVSFDCPTGPSDVVEPGVDGFLVPPEDVGALSHEIISMIEMGDRRRQMADAAYTKSLEYRIPAVAAQWETMFEGLRPSAGSRRQLSHKASRPR
jgi:glycosyltransferase involved in cell wall biosynthesis